MNQQSKKPEDTTPFPTKDDHPDSPSPAMPPEGVEKKRSEEDRLDEGLDETFPASDPVSISTEKPKKKPGKP